jgi:hypothetical protein
MDKVSIGKDIFIKSKEELCKTLGDGHIWGREI